ncbi:hypothetical protein NDU88_008713 [Pleurodeles waltl]|uniref:Uncharacterized protein n=1 Tax=Pleurodeles waltl TaxID=8319 RepID=A0AAV7QSJ3_PLEWA|nr:hypothetical protein NDU88_008713 [Pleurodeles waltl]
MFNSPEDVWTLLHTKGLMHPTRESTEEATWLTPQTKRRREKSSREKPSRVQAAREQEKAIKETSQLISNPFFALTDNPSIASDTDTGPSPPSRAHLRKRARH